MSNSSGAISQFFCQTTNSSTTCLSPTHFLDSHFRLLCASGNCANDCLQFPTVFSYVPQTSPEEPTLFGICVAASSIYETIQEGILPKEQGDLLSPYFDFLIPEVDEKIIADTVALCLADSCNQIMPQDASCSAACMSSSLVINSTGISLQGASGCLQSICNSSLYLPLESLADQEIVGIGVLFSYFTQCLIVLLCWTVLVIPDFNPRKSHRTARQEGLREEIVSSLADLQKALCYFSIPLQIAALSASPFDPGPLTTFEILPVAVNGFLPQATCLILIHQYGRKSWYLVILTTISWTLSSIVFWTMEYFTITMHLNTSTPLSNKGLAAGVSRLGNVNSCGKSSALNLCESVTGIEPVSEILSRSAVQVSIVGAMIAPAVWCWCGICLLILILERLRATNLPKEKGILSSLVVKLKQILEWLYQKVKSTRTRYFGGEHVRLTLHIVIFVLVLLSFVLQFFLLYSYLFLGLVDKDNWSFGQIVAFMVWIPPMIDYLHVRIRGIAVGAEHRLPPSLQVSRVVAPMPAKKPLSPPGATRVATSSADQLESSPPSLHKVDTHPSDATNQTQPEPQSGLSSAIDSPLGTQLKSRRAQTLRMEEGASASNSSSHSPQTVHDDEVE